MLYQSLYYAVAGCSGSACENIHIMSSNGFKIVNITFSKHTTGIAKTLISQNKSQTVVTVLQQQFYALYLSNKTTIDGNNKSLHRKPEKVVGRSMLT